MLRSIVAGQRGLSSSVTPLGSIIPIPIKWQDQYPDLTWWTEDVVPAIPAHLLQGYRALESAHNSRELLQDLRDDCALDLRLYRSFMYPEPPSAEIVAFTRRQILDGRSGIVPLDHKILIVPQEVETQAVSYQSPDESPRRPRRL